MKWATADLHLNHNGILAHRPFKNIWSMNALIIRNWNEDAKPNDVVYCAGDMIWPARWPGTTEPAEILKQLNGHIIYIPSMEWTHEKALLKCGEDRFDKITPLLTIREVFGGQKTYLTFCHYALQVWPKSHYNQWHCHGHSHCRLNPVGKRLDVGVDGHNFRLWSFDEIGEYMEKQPDNFNFLGRREG